MSTAPHVLTIAGSDSGGGAGIQADLKTFLAHETYGMSVITALTAQNTQGVSAIHTPPAEFVKQQFDSVSSDIRIDGIKIGMLANLDVVRTVAACIRGWRTGNSGMCTDDGTCAAGGLTGPGTVVLDPVMVSTSGSLLLSHDAVSTLISDLLPQCDVLTPNLMEAVQLLRHTGRHADAPLAEAIEKNATVESALKAAQALSSLGAGAVVVKGGHYRVRAAEIESQLAKVGFVVPVGMAGADAQGSGHTEQACVRDADATGTHFAAPAHAEHAEIARALGASVYESGAQTLVLVHGASDVRALQRNADAGEASYTVDVLVERSGATTLFVKPAVHTSASHGTGCTFASAICAQQALGRPVCTAVGRAVQFTQEALAAGLEGLGRGSGPLDHAGQVVPRGVPVRSERRRCPLAAQLISRSWPLWVAFTRHAFPARMVRGTLSPEAFTWYLRQDYIYLRHYARVWSLAAASPSCTLAEIEAFAALARSAAAETEMHVALCGNWGISRAELEKTPESRATMAYTRFVLDAANEGLLALLVSVFSCAIGYAEVGLWQRSVRGQLKDRVDSPYTKAYDQWADEYGGEAFQSTVAQAMDQLEHRAELEIPAVYQTERLQQIWDTATRMEIGMWDEAIAHGERVAGRTAGARGTSGIE